jgi:aminomethyltransferase
LTVAEIKQTPFAVCHERAGAKMVEFAGYQMPIQYRSIQQEHLKVRQSVGLFDLSHMGEFFVTGPGALDFLQRTNTNDVSKLEVGGVLYSAMCYEDGGIVDDLLIYKLAEGYMLVVNAANIDKDYEWLAQHKPADVELVDRSSNFGLLAIQGPQTEKVMAKLVDLDLSDIGFYSWRRAEIQGRQTLFSRTGYTGEDGFEIYCDPEIAVALWEAALAAGQEFDIEPIGLGARDSLRLEMRYMLYGNDIDATTNPLEAGLAWVCKLDKPDFIGKDAILKMKADKPPRKLQSLVLTDKAIPRQGYPIFVDDEQVGQVTSGVFSPSLQQGIALGYVRRGFGKIGNQVQIEVRQRKFTAEIAKGAFYKQGTHK